MIVWVFFLFSLKTDKFIYLKYKCTTEKQHLVPNTFK